MKIKSIKKTFFILLSSLFLVACSPKNNNIDIDLSNLPRPKKIVNKTNNKNNDTTKPDHKSYISDLVLLKNKDQILSKFKYGRKDPFSKRGITENKLFSDLKITGFLNSKSKKYVFVIYQDKQGSITDNSIGGLNTNLLPNGAKVLNIDPIGNKLIIKFENRDYVFEL